MAKIDEPAGGREGNAVADKAGTTGGRAFIGSFTSEGGRGIVAAEVDRRTGALTVTGATDAVADPSFLAFDPRTDRLYAVSETEEGAVAALTVADGAPRPVAEPVAVHGASPTHLALAAGHVVTANYGSGSVTALPLGKDGAPGPASGVLRYRGSGPHPDRQRGPHAHQVVPDPSGRWLLCTDLGTDTVHVCALDAATGEPVRHGGTALHPGVGPRHLAFHPAGTHAYVLCELEPVLVVCRWDAEAGALEPVGPAGGIPVLPPGARTPSHPSGIAVDRGGRFVWAAVRGDDSIAVLALDGTGERAELVTTVPCGGHWPRELTLDPEGRRLYVSHERSGDVTWFDIDPETGVPVRAGAIEVPAASCVVFA